LVVNYMQFFATCMVDREIFIDVRLFTLLYS
jgi:hypothetical protein